MDVFEKHLEFEKKVLNSFLKDGEEPLYILINEFAAAKTTDIAAAVGPISHITAPVQIMLLEGYAERIREQFPQAGKIAENLKEHSTHQFVKVSVPRRIKLD